MSRRRRDVAKRHCAPIQSEAAVATLAQLSLQQGKIDTAVRMFERHTELARSEAELGNALTYQYVSKNKS